MRPPKYQGKGISGMLEENGIRFDDLRRDEEARNRDDFLQLAADKISMEGAYARTWRDESAFEEFVASVQAEGQIHEPVGVREIREGMDIRYVLVYGAQRLEAARKLGLSVPARSYGQLPEAEALALQAMENLARNDMHIADEALAYHRLQGMGLTLGEMARRFGRQKSTVSRYAAAGAAVALLEAEDRERVYRRPEGLGRLFNLIADRGLTPEKGARELVAWGRGKSSEIIRGAGRRPHERQMVNQQVFANGRAWRVNWRRTELRTKPVAFARELGTMLAEELRYLEAELRTMGDAGKEALDLLVPYLAAAEKASPPTADDDGGVS